MTRLTPARSAELEAFWRSHHEGWANSTLNQREYCEAHGLPLKRFGNWRAKFKDEAAVRKGLQYRRGGLGHMSSHMTDRDNEPTSTGYVPSGKGLPEVRRNFRRSDKRRIVAEASAPGASVSAAARRYGIAPRLLFRWKQELGVPQARPKTEPVFLPVTVSDAAVTAEVTPTGPAPYPPVCGPLIIERAPQEDEVELVGGRRAGNIASLYSDTAKSVSASGNVYKGRNEIKSALCKNENCETSLSTQLIGEPDINIITSDVAIVELQFQASGGPAGAPQKGRIAAVTKNHANSWQIERTWITPL